MATHWPTKGGVNLVGEYQVSGHTYIVDRKPSNSTANRVIDLKFLSNEVTIIAEVDDLIVTFRDGGNNDRAIRLTAGSHTFRIKCKRIAFSNSKASSAIIACTGIPASDYVPPNFTVLGTIT